MGTPEHVLKHNRKAWDLEVANGNPWTVPASPELIARARQGDWQIVLTPTKPVPAIWFPDLKGCRVLCLASGGGQQGPILSAAGADVTVLDNSPRQLQADIDVARREELDLKAVDGDMADLSIFGDSTFDLIVHPVSNCFVPNILPVWHEAFRVLSLGGRMMAGFIHPVDFLFDEDLAERGIFQLKYRMPYSDLTSISAAERTARYGADELYEFGHTLSDQIGGQIDAGFLLAGFYEDAAEDEKINAYMPNFIATLAVKPPV
jgi:SAM-dependent methyltransferase